MTKKSAVILAGCVVLGAFLILLVVYEGVTHRRGPRTARSVSEDIRGAAAAGPVNKRQAIQADQFIDQQTLSRSFVTEASSKSSCKNYRGGIVNHHVLSADLMARFFVELARCRPDIERIVIISPDHFVRVQSSLVTTRQTYRTGGERVMVDEEWLNTVEKEFPGLKEQDELFVKEHGVGALIPFLHRVLPQVKIVPLVVSARLSSKEGMAFVQLLKKNSDEKTFFLVSADMSHYLAEPAALTNDKKTKTALTESNAEFFLKTNSDFTDNGKGIWLAINTLSGEAGPGSAGDHPIWRLQAESVSTRYGGSPSYTTTYINGFWE